MFILKLARLRLFLAQFTLKIQISRYIVNKLLFLIIFVERNFTNFDIKKVKSNEKDVNIKIIQDSAYFQHSLLEKYKYQYIQ